MHVDNKIGIHYKRLQQFTFWSPMFFRLLFDLCQLSEKTIEDNLAKFNSTSLVTINLLTNDTFHHYSETFIDSFKQNMIQSSNHSLSLIRATTLTNGLVSTLALIILHEFDYQDENITINLTYSLSYRHLDLGNDHCYCFSNLFCKKSVLIEYWNVPGFYWSCSIIEATLVSDLHCLFDQNCLKELEMKMSQVYLPFHSVSINSSLLNSDIFHPNSTIQQIFDELMVNRWKENI